MQSKLREHHSAGLYGWSRFAFDSPTVVGLIDERYPAIDHSANYELQLQAYVGGTPGRIVQFRHGYPRARFRGRRRARAVQAEQVLFDPGHPTAVPPIAVAAAPAVRSDLRRGSRRKGVEHRTVRRSSSSTAAGRGRARARGCPSTGVVRRPDARRRRRCRDLTVAETVHDGIAGWGGSDPEVRRRAPFEPDPTARHVGHAPHLDVELAVSRQIDRFLSIAPVSLYGCSARAEMLVKRTMSGKKMGNQLSMSPAARSGWIDRPMSAYRTASK